MAQTESREKGADVRFPPPLVWLGGLILGIFIDRFVLAAPFPIARTASLTIGAILMAIGAALPVSARLQFKPRPRLPCRPNSRQRHSASVLPTWSAFPATPKAMRSEWNSKSWIGVGMAHTP